MNLRNLILAILTAALAGCGAESASRDRLDVAWKELENPMPNYASIGAAADAYLAEDPSGNQVGRALYLRGRALEEKAQRDPATPQQDFSNAYSYYSQALTKSPPAALEGLIRAGRGNVLYFQDRYAEAIGELRTGHELMTNDGSRAWALYRVGLCQQRLAQWEQADQTFASVQQKYPGGEQARRAMEHAGQRQFWVQVGAYAAPAPADAVVTALKKEGQPAARFAEPGGRGNQYVRIGPFASYASALAVRQKLWSRYAGALVIP